MSGLHITGWGTRVKERILLVEDDPVSTRVTEYALSKQGYDVITAANGLAALRVVREESPALIVLDVMLPGIDGFEVLSRLRRGGGALPVVMCSGLGGEAERRTAFQLGASEYLVKPVAPSAIKDAVARLLPSERPSHSVPLGETHG